MNEEREPRISLVGNDHQQKKVFFLKLAIKIILIQKKKEKKKQLLFHDFFRSDRTDRCEKRVDRPDLRRGED